MGDLKECLLSGCIYLGGEIYVFGISKNILYQSVGWLNLIIGKYG